MSNIEKYIKNSVTIYENNEERDAENFEEARAEILKEFDRVANYPGNISRYPDEFDRFSDFLAGLPFSFDFTYYDIKERMKELDLKVTDDDQINNERYNRAIYNAVFGQ